LNIIPFPERSPRHVDAEHRTVGFVMAALRLVGEPATLPEICAQLEAAQLDVGDRGLDGISTLLEDHSDSGVATSIFQKVSLRGEPAWAFTPEIRLILRQSGLAPTLRA
jgi:hypothetical protein